MSEEATIHCPLHYIAEITPCDPAEIAPLIAHLAADLPVTQPTPFPRGTVLEDGRLDLCKQQLGPMGCRLVTKALATNTTITSLLLGTDGIGDEGAADVARLIARNERLEIIYLGCNRIGEQGVATLAATLTQNCWCEDYGSSATPSASRVHTLSPKCFVTTGRCVLWIS